MPAGETTLLTGATLGQSSDAFVWDAIKKVERTPPAGNQLQLNSRLHLWFIRYIYICPFKKIYIYIKILFAFLLVFSICYSVIFWTIRALFQ